jgi:hypothetical protein
MWGRLSSVQVLVEKKDYLYVKFSASFFNLDRISARLERR